MASIVGIDLGTSYSVLASIDEAGRPYVVRDDEGHNLVPSCVCLMNPDDKIVEVGEEAMRQWGIPGATNVVARFKRDMGTSKTYLLGDKEYSPIELSAFILKKLVNISQKYLGPISKAVVTVPANFANEAREGTMAAARMAGLDIEYIINEPTAAALYYAYRSGQELNGYYAVYDLGGGTFDISIIRAEGQNIEVLCSNGVQKLGGDDFDEALLKLVQKKYKDLVGTDLDLFHYNKTQAEEDKRSLSRKETIKVYANRNVIAVTRKEFEEAISSKIAQAEMLCEAVLDEAGITPDQIEKVFLAGGSTRVPIVMQSLMRVFGQDPQTDANVDEVVALGASLYAAYRTEKEDLNPAQRIVVESIALQEVTAMNYGTVVYDESSTYQPNKTINDIIIKRNEQIPCSVTKSYYTVAKNQTGVLCRVTECLNDERDLRFTNTVFEEELELPGGRPAGMEVKVTYEYTVNQTMYCTFMDIASGRTKKAFLSFASETRNDCDIDEFIVE